MSDQAGLILNMLGMLNMRVVKLNDDVKFTKNHYGTIDDLKNSQLILFERNIAGDCMCKCTKGYLVDVDHRDIKAIVPALEGLKK